ncbi:coproporphyrinogen III oxidase [Arachidicoccus ginsenosidimutans]|uniref:radical SAM family heme chaperone HemW n=1 Tax=Arachidicoccus sp. BS20 TaxID=1850526 RepID=UPI0007F0DB25|nr:radical SAM family heme chaperone HemW [Arachidicoccus sp. BS20]ANI90271.1 coproporphyrinogen III oxidase [Arachidicoccus sp. BS20]
MSGIYIHIPYCKKACHYCNFHFSTTRYNSAEMMNCIRQEIDLRKNRIDDEVETIYFGGGTPSIINADELEKIVDKIKKNFPVSDNAEITLESNPDDINKEKLLQWKSIGINRLSIGTQSFCEEDLQWMNRAHSATQAFQSIVLAQENGFLNISADLIYGTPMLTDELWRNNLQKITELNIPHLSAYALTVEPKTALHKMIEKHKTPDIDLEKQVRHFDILMQWATQNNFEHYEISNFAKQGFRSRHNSSYWQGKRYLGIGPSAHSFNGNARQWNIANNALYIQSLKSNQLNFEEEILSGENKLNELIMISLRTIEGIDLGKIETDFSFEHKIRLEIIAKKFLNKKMLALQNNHLTLTNRGKHYADGIAADLFV